MPTAVPHHAPAQAIDPLASTRRMQQRPGPSNWLADLVAERMAQRLAWLRQQPRHWLDWQPNVGGRVGHQLVRQHYPRAMAYIQAPHHTQATRAWLWQGTAWSIAWQRWRRARPWLGHPSVDLLWANMVAHQVTDPDALLRTWHAAMGEHGALLFSALGPSTLQGLDTVAQAMGAAPMHHAFIDMHDWGDALLRAGFAEPVMDAQRLSLTYSSLDKLIADLRAAGRNLHPGRTPHMLGRGWLSRWRQALAQHLPRNAHGHWVLDVELVFGHAWRVPTRAAGDSARPMQATGRLGQLLGTKPSAD